MLNYTNDTTLNDFLYCTEYFGERPSKVVLTFNFNSEKFTKYFDNTEIINVISEVLPAEETSIVNEKFLVKIKNKEAFISYTHVDKNVETGYVTNVIIYYKLSCDISEILSELDSIIDTKTNTEEANKVNIITHGPNGLILSDIDVLNADYDNIEMYYNSVKGINKIIKKINEHNKGLCILHGKRGCGKTTALNYIATKVNKIAIFIPNNMLDYTINNPEFIEILKTYNPLLILDDCEILFDNMFVKSNVTYSNILQIIDGFYSDEINTHIIMSYNTDTEDDIDSDLLDANNLLKVVKIEPLKMIKANELSNQLKLGHEVKNDILLIDLLKKNFKEVSTSVGYN